MNAVCCDKEEEEDNLESCECDVCCDKEGGRWSRREDGLKEVGKEVRHDELVVEKSKSASRSMRTDLESVGSFGKAYADG